MARSPPSTRTMVLVIVILAAITCTVFSMVCIGVDETVAALSVSVTAIVLSGIGILVLALFMNKRKTCLERPSQPVILHNVRPNVSNIPDRPPYPSLPPMFVPPFPMPPPQIIGEGNTVFIQPPAPGGPPSYDESAEIEDRRITDNSNAPPAYNRTDYVSDNNIASFSPPPYYSPPSPFFGTSVQTSTMYLSAENVSEAPTPAPSSPLRIRSPSPVRRHPARKPRRSPRQPKPQNTAIVIDDQPGASTSTSAIPKTPTRTPLPQMFIDCSKAEPTLFSINGEESII